MAADNISGLYADSLLEFSKILFSKWNLDCKKENEDEGLPKIVEECRNDNRLYNFTVFYYVDNCVCKIKRVPSGPRISMNSSVCELFLARIRYNLLKIFS